MFQDVFLIGGTGSVGSKVIEQIYSLGDTEREKHETPIRVVGIASSKEYLFETSGLTKDQAIAFSRKESHGSGYANLLEILALTNQSIPYGLIFTDTTAATDVMRDFHLAVMEHSKSGIVTANKNPITLYDMEIFERLTSHRRRYGFRCSVMAGAETVKFLQESRIVNNCPSLIVGCFSGTLGYICSQLEQGATIQEATREAFDKKYTEPHPRDDLSGLDVARKLLILARTTGFNCGLEDIALTPFVDRELLGEEDPERFIASLASLNGHFKERIIQAEQRGEVPRYTAKMQRGDGGIEMTVVLEFVPKDSPLGSLKGTINKVVIVDRTHSIDGPYELCAPGAGLEITAENIRKEVFTQLTSNAVY